MLSTCESHGLHVTEAVIGSLFQNDFHGQPFLSVPSAAPSPGPVACIVARAPQRVCDSVSSLRVALCPQDGRTDAMPFASRNAPHESS